MSEQNIDYTSMIYGNRNAQLPRRATGRGVSSVNYDELYRQANQGNFSGMTAPMAGFAAGSSDFLADYMRQNNQAQSAGMSPINFNAMLGPRPPEVDETGKVDYAAIALPGMEENLQQVRDSAYQDYMSRGLQNLDLQRQQALLSGSDRFAQARMAMEQQGALSDTRGLTAGARQGAEGQVSAQQQLVFNAIERGTTDDLRQLEAQGISLDFAADEWATNKVQQFQKEDPSWMAVQATTKAYEMAYNSYDSTNPESVATLANAEIKYLESLGKVSGVDFSTHIEKAEQRLAAGQDPYSIISDEMTAAFEEATAPEGSLIGLGAELAIPAGALLLTRNAVAKRIPGTGAKILAKKGLTSNIAKGLYAGYQTAAGVSATNAVITTQAVNTATNPKVLVSMAKALGIPKAQLAKATTVKALRALVTKKLGASGAATVAKTALGKSTAAALGVSGKSILFAKGAMLLKGGAALVLAKPLLVAAAVVAVGVGLYMGYQALQNHFGPGRSDAEMKKIVDQEYQNLVEDGMSPDEANSTINGFIEDFPTMNFLKR